MCGIIGAIRLNAKPDQSKNTKLNKEVRQVLQNQLSRGRQGFGVVSWNAAKHNSLTPLNLTRSTELTEALLALWLQPASGLIVHHRMPTSSSNTISQTHPIDVGGAKFGFKYNYLVIHNGIITNDIQLKEVHKKEGIAHYSTEQLEYGYNVTWNDSEALAWEVARAIEHKHIKRLRTKGNAAFIALKYKKINGNNIPISLFWGRNSNPLKIMVKDGMMLLASVLPSNSKDVTPNMLFEFDLKTEKTTSRKLKIPENTKSLGFNSTTTKDPYKEREEDLYQDYLIKNTQNSGKKDSQDEIGYAINKAETEIYRNTGELLLDLEDHLRGDDVIDADTYIEYYLGEVEEILKNLMKDNSNTYLRKI